MLIQSVLVVSVTAAAVVWARLAGGGGGAGAGGGWLGRLVQYHREAFLNDYERFDTHMVNIQASVEPAPQGYSDPPGWDEPSVLRLLALVAHTRDPSMKPVKTAIRRALRPTRRYMPYIPPGMSSRDVFPSLAGNIPNFIYNDESYETTSEEQAEETSEERRQREWQQRYSTKAPLNATELDKVAVLVVRNPVEARLPSARISVNLLRKILEQRALAARVMTPSTRRTLIWRHRVNTTTTPVKTSTTPAITTTTPAPDHGAATDRGKGGDGTPNGTEAGNETTTVVAPNVGGNNTEENIPGGNNTDGANAGGDTPDGANTGSDTPGGDTPGGDTRGGDTPDGDTQRRRRREFSRKAIVVG